MKRSSPFVIVLVLVFGANSRSAVIDVDPQRGRTVTAIEWVDETGATHNLSQFAGYPVVLLPIYTRCRGACVQNVDRLKNALAASSADPRQFRVLLFSFDPSDHPATLARYRDREAIPLSWSVGSASQPNIDALLDSIGFQVGKAGSEFTHPNMVLFLDPNLRIARWIYGTGYSTGDVDGALGVASGESDWLTRYSQWFYAIFLFAGSLLCVALCYYLAQLKASRARQRLVDRRALA